MVYFSPPRWKAALFAFVLAFLVVSPRWAGSQEATPQSAPSPAPTPVAVPTPSAAPTPARAPVAPSSPAPPSAQTPPSAPIAPSTPQQAPESTPPIPEGQQEIVFVAVGDVMLGTTFPDETGGDLPPNDGADLLKEVTPLLKLGDITFGNLEGPLVDGGVSAKCKGKRAGTCYAFRVPTRYAKYLKEAGFSVMGLANNHATDFGEEGRASSRGALEQVGIAHTGEVGDIAHLTVKGKKVDVVAFATYPNANNLLDLDRALETIRDARAEADIVIVSFHGGAEGATHQHVAEGDETFLGEDRGDLRKFAHAAVDAGAQVVVGSGPHVVRGMEIYQGKLIAYSLGNFATYGPFNLSAENGLSLILEAHLGMDGSFLGGRVHPVKQEKPGGPKLDAALSIVPILRDLSATDFGDNSVKVADDGSLTPPPKPPVSSLPTPDARLLKTGRFPMLATGGKDRIMLWQEFPDGTISELTGIQTDAQQEDSVPSAAETKRKLDH